jgi:hypothetical protein
MVIRRVKPPASGFVLSQEQRERVVAYVSLLIEIDRRIQHDAAQAKAKRASARRRPLAAADQDEVDTRKRRSTDKDPQSKRAFLFLYMLRNIHLIQRSRLF